MKAKNDPDGPAESLPCSAYVVFAAIERDGTCKYCAKIPEQNSC